MVGFGCSGGVEQGFLTYKQSERLSAAHVAQIFGWPRHIRLFPFIAGVCAEIGESFAFNGASRQDVCHVSVSHSHLIHTL